MITVWITIQLRNFQWEPTINFRTNKLRLQTKLDLSESIETNFPISNINMMNKWSLIEIKTIKQLDGWSSSVVRDNLNRKIAKIWHKDHNRKYLCWFNAICKYEVESFRLVSNNLIVWFNESRWRRQKPETIRLWPDWTIPIKCRYIPWFHLMSWRRRATTQPLIKMCSCNLDRAQRQQTQLVCVDCLSRAFGQKVGHRLDIARRCDLFQFQRANWTCCKSQASWLEFCFSSSSSFAVSWQLLSLLLLLLLS